MIALAWGIIRTLAPYLIIAGILAADFTFGYYRADMRRVKEIADINAKSELIVKQADEKNATVKESLIVAQKHIEATANANRQIIESLADDNSKRVQLVARRCPITLPKDRTSTSSSDGTDTDTRKFWQGFVEEARRADEVTETARACQSYLDTLQYAFK